MNVKKMYFFNPDIESYQIIFLMIRMIGCLLIGQRILAISTNELTNGKKEDENQVRFYFHRE